MTAMSPLKHRALFVDAGIFFWSWGGELASRNRFKSWLRTQAAWISQQIGIVKTCNQQLFDRDLF